MGELRKGIDKLPTGIKGLDEMLIGGLPRGRAALITGPTGTGKTVFLNSFIYLGITKFNENGVYVTFEETPTDIISNVESFGWDYDSLIENKKLVFIDVSPNDSILEIGQNYDFTPLFKRIELAIHKVNAKRVVMDCIDAFFARFSNKDAVRSSLNQIAGHLKTMGVTTLISGEKTNDENRLTRYGVEEFVSDAVLELDLIKGQQQFLRTIYVRKIRGANYRSGLMEFDITSDGIEVFPKIPFKKVEMNTDYSIRRKIGVRQLDKMLDGGIPQGHIVLLSGNTGTGKTTFGMQFLVTGIKEGENAVFVALEEPIEQLKKTAKNHGWDFEHFQKEEKLEFVNTNLIDIRNDRLLYSIINAVNRIGASRVVIDSVSSLMSASMNEEQVRQFLIQLSGFFKEKGVTCIMNYLTGTSFGAVKGQLMSNIMTNDMRLSSITDGIILLLYVERGQSVKKMLNILKLRGSKHSKEVYRYEIEKGRINIIEKYEE